VVSLRKQPRQVRSTRLVADILEAAVRVLARDGAHRFTTARVAEAKPHRCIVKCPNHARMPRRVVV
jgi:hypothetical protein